MSSRTFPMLRRAAGGPLARSTGARRGAAAVELALCLPMLAAFVLGVADFGRAIDAEIVVSHAARAGADYAATHRYTPATYANWTNRIREAVLVETTASQFAAQDVVVQVSVSQVTDDLKTVTVTVRLPFQLLFAWPGMGSQMTLEQSVTMSQFR